MGKQKKKNNPKYNKKHNNRNNYDSTLDKKEKFEKINNTNSANAKDKEIDLITEERNEIKDIKKVKDIKKEKVEENKENKKIDIENEDKAKREVEIFLDEEKMKEDLENYTVPKLEIPNEKKSNVKSKDKKNEETETSILLDRFMNINENNFETKKHKSKVLIQNDKKNFRPVNPVNNDDNYNLNKENLNNGENNKPLNISAKDNINSKNTGNAKELNIKNQKTSNVKKVKKKLNVKNLIKLIFKIFLVILLVVIIFKGIGFLKNMQDIKKSDVIEKDIAISDYTLAPLTNYGIYKTIPTVKGVYLSEYTMASSSNVDKWIKICNEKEINALVINVKNDDGRISFAVDNQVANEIGADANRTIKDPAELVLKLKQAGIFPIARIVAFKDPYLAKNRPDLAIKDHSGNVLRIKSGNNWEAWVNPYNRELWEYIVDISKCAADVGFKEIQYDYIRFATGPQIKDANFGFDSATKTSRDIVLEFSRYAKNELEKYGVYVSADVFGTIITSDYDAKIVGQNYLEMGKIYDFLCPMIYPSHYNNGSLGVKYPDLDPYNLVLNAMKASNEVLDAIPKGEHRAVVRAWLQDFTAPWVTPHQTYGAKQLVEQKNAVYDSQNEEWLLWNAGNKYSLDGLLAD